MCNPIYEGNHKRIIMKEKKIYCPHCGHVLLDGALFCKVCGKKVRDSLPDVTSVSVKEQITEYFRYIGKEDLSEAFLRSQVSCIVQTQETEDHLFYSKYVRESIQIKLLEEIFEPYMRAAWSPGPHTDCNSSTSRYDNNNGGSSSFTISGPASDGVQKEVIVMTISGVNKDLLFLRANDETIRNGIKHLFRKYGISLDVERIIFTLGESSQSIPQRSVSKIDKLSYDIIRAEQVLDDLIEVGKRICLNSSYNKKTPENKINDSVRDMLSMKGYYEVKDQTRHGISTSGKDSGNVDLLLAKGGNELAIIEALRLKYIDGPYIDLHIRKAIINYNPLGTPTFILAYVNYYYFQSFWNRYYDYIKQYQFPETITVQQDFEEILEPNATTRIAKVVLSKDGYDFPVYFIALKISDE